MKKPISILLLLLFVFSAFLGITVSALELQPVDDSHFKSFIKIEDSGDYTEISEQTFQTARMERTAWQYKTKNVYTNAGKLVAKVTLQYSTYIYGGRPQFDEAGSCKYNL